MVEILDVPHVMITHVMITPRDSNAPRPCVFVEEVVMSSDRQYEPRLYKIVGIMLFRGLNAPLAVLGSRARNPCSI